MIITISGTVAHRGKNFVIISCQGIGYKVIWPENAVAILSGAVTLYTHEVQREDGRELFGFLTMAALELFWKLLEVSGVGPRNAQKIIFAAPVEEVRANIMKGNLAFFTEISGVGTKRAQKIILELKGVLVDGDSGTSVDRDAVEALIGLGYQRRQAEEALRGIEGESTEDRIRSALKVLSR